MVEEAYEKDFGYRNVKKDLKKPAAKILTEHTVAADETLSHIALKYYGSAVKDKWMLIYEANKAVIGDDPGRIRSGQVLKIPELPQE
jgi:nucleoid-associated protein YgaU